MSDTYIFYVRLKWTRFYKQLIGAIQIATIKTVQGCDLDRKIIIIMIECPFTIKNFHKIDMILMAAIWIAAIKII